MHQFSNWFPSVFPPERVLDASTVEGGKWFLILDESAVSTNPMSIEPTTIFGENSPKSRANWTFIANETLGIRYRVEIEQNKNLEAMGESESCCTEGASTVTLLLRMVGPLFLEECQFRISRIEDSQNISENSRVTSDENENEMKGQTKHVEAVEAKRNEDQTDESLNRGTVIAEQSIDQTVETNSGGNIEQRTRGDLQEIAKSPGHREETQVMGDLQVDDDRDPIQESQPAQVEVEEGMKNEIEEEQSTDSPQRTPVKQESGEQAASTLEWDMAEYQRLSRPMLYNHNSVLMGESIEEINVNSNYFVKRRKGERTPTTGKKRDNNQEFQCSICYSTFSVSRRGRNRDRRRRAQVQAHFLFSVHFQLD